MSLLAINSRSVSDVVILDLSGRFSVVDDSLRELVNSHLSEGRRNFLLNLAGVSYLGTWGINQIISIWTSIRNRGGAMGLVGLVDRVREVFVITNLITVLPIYGDETEALRHLFK